MMTSWLVYLVECSDSTFYCGITNNLENRLKKHNNGTASKYTRGRLPVVLIACQHCDSRSAALKLEAKVKKLPKRDKLLMFGRTVHR